MQKFCKLSTKSIYKKIFIVRLELSKIVCILATKTKRFGSRCRCALVVKLRRKTLTSKRKFNLFYFKKSLFLNCDFGISTYIKNETVVKLENYIETLLIEKGIIADKDDVIKGIECEVYGVVDGLTYGVIIDFYASMPAPIKKNILNTFTLIDFKNGDVMHYFKHITNGYFKANKMNTYSIK